MTAVRWGDAEVVAVLILAGMALTKKQEIEWGDGWHWPVPDLSLDGIRYDAIITSGFQSGRHPGVDIMYRRRRDVDPSIVRYPSGVTDAFGARQAAGYFAPLGTPILAAKAGTVWSVLEIPQGVWVVIDHGKPWATSYHHLHDANVRKGDVVAAGQEIGTMGHNPNTDPRKGKVDGERLRHLHFEPWYRGGDWRATVDPMAVIATWGRALWTP